MARAKILSQYQVSSDPCKETAGPAMTISERWDTLRQVLLHALQGPTASPTIWGKEKKANGPDPAPWKPAFFGVKPELVLKGGMIAYAQMGDANASIPSAAASSTPRPMFASFGRARHAFVPDPDLPKLPSKLASSAVAACSCV